MINADVILGDLYLFLSAFLGFITITIIDRIWFLIDYKKAEKGLEVLEHYHYGIVLIGMSILLMIMVMMMSANDIDPALLTSVSFALAGAGITFIYHESKQKNMFSYHSNHFVPSTVIGIALCIFPISVVAVIAEYFL